MKQRDSGHCSATRELDPRVEEFLADLRAELEKNPGILDEILEAATELNASFRRIVEGLEESNRRGERHRKEMDALMAEIHAQAR
jgi:predicted  nucleic acid-binding Zn-ribbon protein